MNYEKIMTEIKSVREFKKDDVDSNLLSLVVKEAEEAEKMDSSELRISIIEDGESFFKDYNGKIGYFGKLIKAPKYILLFGKNDKKAKFKGGYLTEWIRFKLEDKELSSCWISETDDVDYKELFKLEGEETLIACLAVGYEYDGVFKRNIDKKAERKGAVEFVYEGSFGNPITWEKLAQMGLEEVFYLAKFAPSWGNKQPWSFIITDKEVYLVMEKNEDSDLDLEAGIIALFFVKGGQAKGFDIKMESSDTLEALKVPETQEIKLKFFL